MAGIAKAVKQTLMDATPSTNKIGSSIRINSFGKEECAMRLCYIKVLLDSLEVATSE
ncbi:hypothetical protein SESBI_03875 [Sesbania bispinosa]|nr:hypothetical protein SESBI_03875 [Sesbania bispinosa]